MSRSHCDLQRAPSAPSSLLVRRLLPTHSHASIARQGLPGPAPNSAAQNRNSRRAPAGRWPASSLRTPRRLIRPGFLLTYRCAAADTPSPKDSVSEVFRSRSGVGRLWFRSQPVSLKPINSIAILAAVRIPVHMEFLVTTGAESMGLPELVLALLESWRGADLDRHLRIRLVFRGRCVGA